MKQPCKSCGSIDWVKLTFTVKGKESSEWCSECTAPPIIILETKKIPNLGSGAINRNKRITPDKYREAVDKANRTGKDQYL